MLKIIIWSITIHLFPTPSSMTSVWQFEISHGDNIHTTDIKQILENRDNYNVFSRLREVLEKTLIEYIKLNSLQLLQCKYTQIYQKCWRHILPVVKKNYPALQNSYSHPCK